MSRLYKCAAVALAAAITALPVGYTQLSLNGINALIDLEGCQLKPYQCSAKVWTNGIGHTNGVDPNELITEQRAVENLIVDIAVVEQAIDRYVTVPLNQNQYDAIASFVFNVGVGAFRSSTLLTLLNKGEYTAACNQMPRWVYADGKKSKGLIRRRAMEQALCLQR